jgi:hypothetical protein
MTRYLLLISILACLKLTGYSQSDKEVNSDKYIVITPDPGFAKYFKSKNSTYLDYYLSDTVVFDDNEYIPRVRRYSWGKNDTAYFREGEDYFYHYDPKTGKESIDLPKNPTLHQTWMEPDGSWSYTVIGLNEKLKTPVKKYTGLLVVECKQLTGRDVNKHKVYHLYYAKGIGYVANKVNGQLNSYLAEQVKEAKEGTIIDGKK